jgi:signal transduction histidine kinase
LVKETLILTNRLSLFHTFEHMNRRALHSIIGLIVVSLLGIIIVQYLWIRNAIMIKEAQFNRSVNEALREAVNKLETREDLTFMRNHMVGDSVVTLVQAFSQDSIFSLNAKLDSLLAKEDNIIEIPFPPPPPPPPPDGPMNRYESNYSLEYSWSEDFPSADTFMTSIRPYMFVVPDDINTYFKEYKSDKSIRRIDSLMLQYQVENLILPPWEGFRYEQKKGPKPGPGRGKAPIYKVQKIKSGKNGSQIIIQTQGGSSHALNTAIQDDMRKINRKAKKIKEVIHKIAIELESKPPPITKRIDKKNLENILKNSFGNKSIRIPFEFSISTPSNTANPLPIKSTGFVNEYLSTPHRVYLFPNDIFQKPDMLLVYFPGQKNILLRSLSFLMLGSILFTLIIVITSILSIFIMLKQKKISDIKTDFINNMTHEFKTPIATISIALDSINNPKVISEPDVIKSYTRVIKEENNRMNTRVEQILQMALLDSSEFKLNKQVLDLHEILQKVVNHFRLQIESREGQLILQLEALQTLVEADESHLSNVLINLLDNANKYSPVKPVIHVSTRNAGKAIVISVEDHGIGMDPATQHKIFDKFYRVTSGNIHNVKGFGLGLSYSKAIVLAHNGLIAVQSEPGKGSKFEITLPVIGVE